jgi:hypothetical protein
VAPVSVRILHRNPGDVGPLQLGLYQAQETNARRLVDLFGTAGAEDILVVRDGPPGGAGSFGALARDLATASSVAGADRGLVLLGSGSIPLATAADARSFVEVAESRQRRALANNRYSADVLALGTPEALQGLPDLRADNALPRWLEEVAGVEVDDLRRRWRLSVDLDSPLDVLLVDRSWQPPDVDLGVLRDSLTAVRAVAGNRRAELLVAGRTSAATLRWLERSTRSRTRALIEERGLRASSPDATGGPHRPSPRLPRSVLGLLLDDRGPDAFGSILAELGDATIVDTRVLLAHRLGTDESGWAAPEDRFASDLLLPDRIRDPWLRALTASAVTAPIPILLGGHSLVGPGIRLALRGKPR